MPLFQSKFLECLGNNYLCSNPLLNQSRQSSKNLIGPSIARRLSFRQIFGPCTTSQTKFLPHVPHDKVAPLFSSKFRTLHGITHAFSDEIAASCSTRQGGASLFVKISNPARDEISASCSKGRTPKPHPASLSKGPIPSMGSGHRNCSCRLPLASMLLSIHLGYYRKRVSPLSRIKLNPQDNHLRSPLCCRGGL